MREVVFPRMVRFECRLLVKIPRGLRGRTYDVSVRQLYQEQEVGRITWRVAAPPGGPEESRGRRSSGRAEANSKAPDFEASVSVLVAVREVDLSEGVAAGGEDESLLGDRGDRAR